MDFQLPSSDLSNSEKPPSETDEPAINKRGILGLRKKWPKAKRTSAVMEGYAALPAVLPLSLGVSVPLLAFTAMGPVNGGVLRNFKWGSRPVEASCPFCKTSVTSQTWPTAGTLTWLFVSALSMVGCICGCCLVPLFIDNLKDVLHLCPNCRHVLGFYRRI